MQTVQQANWYHRGDGDQRASVLMENSHSLFVRCRVNGHKETSASPQSGGLQREHPSTMTKKKLDVCPLSLSPMQAITGSD